MNVRAKTLLLRGRQTDIRLMRVVVILAVVLAIARATFAGSLAPASSVHVRVAFAVPLAPVAVVMSLADDEGVDASQTANVAPAGSAWFGGLRAAGYRLNVDVPGRPPVSQALRVGPGEVITVDVVVPQAGDPVVSVTARWPSGEGVPFADALLEDLPHGGDLWTLIETAAPFVIAERMDTGGLGVGRSALVGSRGESWAVTAVAIGESTTRFPGATGVLPVVPNLRAVESVTVASGLAPVEVSTPGVHVWLRPKRPGARVVGGGDISVTTLGMVGTNALPDAPSIGRVESWRQGGAFAGGPLSEATGVFVAVDGARVRYADRGRESSVALASTTTFAHLVRRLGDRDEVRILGGAERTRSPFDGRRQFADENVSAQATFGRMQVTWHRATAGGAARTLSFGGQAATLTPGVTTDALGGLVDRVTEGVVPDPAAEERRWQWNLRTDVTTNARRVVGMEHRFKAGLSAERIRVSSSVLALPDVAEAVAGLPARVWRPVSPAVSSSRGVTDAAFYLGDRMSAGRAFVVDVGLRAELTYGAARGAARGFRWATASPRVSFRWQPTVFAVFGGFAQHVAANPLMLTAFGDPGAVAMDVHRWTDPNRNGRFDEGEAGVLVARRGRHRDIAFIDEGLQAPTSREWTIGGEYRTGRLSTLGGAIIIRRTDRLVGSVNDGVPLTAYRAYTIPDISGNEGDPADDQLLPIFERLPASFGLDRFRLTNPEGGTTTYGGVEITWSFVSERWRMYFGATAYRTRGWGGDLNFGPLENDQLVIGERYETPNGTKDSQGSFIFDRSYVGKWAGSYRAPGDIRFAFAVRYQDGQPFTRLVVAPNHAAGPEITHAYRVGRTRFTYTATVDLRVEKGVTVAGRRAAIRLDVFNATNHANEVEEDVVSGLEFRRSTAMQPPITLRLGFALSF